MSERNDQFDRLSEARQMAHFEQTMFWNRFVAFSALNAGMFALIGSAGLPIYMASVGILLSFSWVFIQIRSWVDVMKSKKLHHNARRNAGIFFSKKEEKDYLGGKSEEFFLSQRLRFNVVESGVLCSFIVLSFWIFFLASII